MVEFTPSSGHTEFDRLLDELRGLADSKRMQGNYFEELVRHFLEQDATWGAQFEHVWLWNQWPGRSGADIGVDLVAQRPDGTLTAVQTKFFAESHRVSKNDLNSFLEVMGRGMFTDGIWVDTTGVTWSGHATEALKNRDKPVRTVGLDQLRHSNIDWSTYEVLNPSNAPKQFERKQLRAHQHRAVQQVMDAFDREVERGKMIMACGTGKTFTALKLAERVTSDLSHGTANILFLVPSLALLQQTLEEWSKEHDPEVEFTAFVVGSDETIGRQKTGDITSVRLDELPVPATTDGEVLAREYDNHAAGAEGMTVVFSTYQSIQAVHEAQQLGLERFDLVICDEAHRTTGVTLTDEDESAFVRVHDNDYIDAERRVYMTATPRIFNDNVKNTAREKDAELVSMDDTELYGEELYRLSFGQAVEQNLLTDYKVIVLGVAEDQIATSFQAQLADTTYELPITDVAKLVGCWNGMAKRQSGELAEGFGSDTAPMRRAVAFAKDIKASTRIANEFQSLVEDHLSDIDNDDPTDDLTVQVRHVDGTMRSTERQERLDWLKQDVSTDRQGRPIARVLTNARCLSEGVDVPSLDAVLFLNPRKSQVDVVQAVGRVMRRAEGKQFGYIILPIAIPAGVPPERALNENERYKVVWQVLQALRAHDERLDSAINQMPISGKPPETIVVQAIDLTPKPRQSAENTIGEHASDDGGEDLGGSIVCAPNNGLPPLPGLGSGFDAAWKDSVYAKLVKQVGDRMYWDDWAHDINEIAQRFITLITAHLDAPETDPRPFQRFVKALTQTVNPEVERDEAIEMLAQHMITRPIFDAMFPESEFSAENPVSRALDRVIAQFSENDAFAKELVPLESFYAKVTSRIRGLDNVSSKQQMLVTLYDRFFSQAFPKLRDRMGIVFTPVEVVDYILRSADVLARSVFGKSLSDEGVTVLDPFTGTGTFLTRLLQIGLIRPEDLERKYQHELFANEIVLLSYYIAAVNIEAVFRQVLADSGVEPSEELGFPGISLVDTFAMYDRENRVAGDVFPANSKRIAGQLDSSINVIVMNPPYSVGQSSANDNNQNAAYPGVDGRIRASYTARSTGKRKSQLYDSYYRALRWATDRITGQHEDSDGRGIIAFVSNSGFVDGNTADGVRLTWADEFDDIFVFNLRGNQRTQGELSRKEGGKVFGSGSRTGVAITLLVKSSNSSAPARVHYCDIGDYLTREEKLQRLVDDVSIEHTAFTEITPSSRGDWINQRDERFTSFQAIASRKRDLVGQGPVFSESGPGVSTNRDDWVYGDSTESLMRKVGTIAGEFNRQVRQGQKELSSNRISWSAKLESRFKKGVPISVAEECVIAAAYRPFQARLLYYSADLVERPGIQRNSSGVSDAVLRFAVNTRSGTPLMTDKVLDLHFNGDSQVFPRYTWEPVSADDGGFNLDLLGASDDGDVEVDGYRRVDNITDETLAAYRLAYADEAPELSKDDIFYYVYALLHHGEYRERYEADLKKLLPHIPRCRGFAEYVRIGRELAELHLGYENVPAWDGLVSELAVSMPDDPYELYRIKKLSWTKRTSRTGLKYNDYLTITGIPEAANDYKIGGRSPLEWIIDRYQVKQDKASGIVNDPNDWLREHENPRYVVDLIASLVTVSMRTQELVRALPAFDVIE